ncbi:hypothetical protein FWC63_01845 [Candidatus Saccharibacteria bacterium]|nr:hypothetical protein [Candidatus Saccharibacteria bacterium]
MEIDFDALDQVISQKRVSPRASSPSNLKSPKYIDVIQSGAVRRPNAVRKSSVVRKTKRVVTQKVEKVNPPALDISELINRELDSGDISLGEDTKPASLDVNDLTAFVEAVQAEEETKGVTSTDAAKDFLAAPHELAPFLPNVKVNKVPLSGDVPVEAAERAAERAKKSERELARLDIESDLTLDKTELKLREKERKRQELSQARILTEERIKPRRPIRSARSENSTKRKSPKKSSAPLIIVLGFLIAVFGAVAGAFIYLLTND